MNFDFDVKRLLPDDVNRISGSDLCNNYNRMADYPTSHRLWQNLSNVDQLVHIIDRMGLASAKAQSLHHVITTGDKLKESDHVLYIMTDDHRVVGLLKIGYKKLFLVDRRGTQHEMRPPCVLDFYVHESYQRIGFGKRLFEFMMRDLKVDAHQLAIDRPSSKFLAFLSRHYQLSNPVHQGNHFTVFEEIFPNGNSDDEDDDPLQSRWPKLRRSDPTTGHCKSKVRTSNRNSYPPSVDCRNSDKIREANSSVASVVFGQLRQASQDMCNAQSPRDSFYSPRCEPNSERAMRNGGGSTELLRPAMDSSFNIFGVPSPDYGGTNAHRG